MNSLFSNSATGFEKDGRSLTPLAAWPAAAARYLLGGTGVRPELAVTVLLSPGAGLPGPEDAPAASQAAEWPERYRALGTQLDQPGLAVSLLTSLDESLSLPVADGVVALRRFARSAELFAQAVAMATAPELTGLATLGELLERYGLTADRLAAANADRPLNRLLAAGQPLAMRTGQTEPDVVPAGISTLAQVAAGLRISPGRLIEDNRDLKLAAEPALVLPGIITLPSEARVPYAVRAGDTLVGLARRFGSTARELVAGNAEVTGTLLPGISVEVAVSDDAEPVLASTETLAGDSFASVHARLAGQHAELGLDALADALDRLGPVLAPGPVLSCPLAVLGSGRDADGPLTAAEAAAEYGCPPAAFAAANAALAGLLQPGVRISRGDRATTTTEQDTLHAVLDRLGADAGLPWSEELDRLLADHAAVPLFRPGARALLPPAPVTLTAAPGQALEPVGPAVPLTVTLRLARGEEHADTPLPPGHGWDDLVEACLATLPAVRLATDPDGTVWAVPFGGTGISRVRITPPADQAAQPPAFGMPALYPTLLDFDATVSPVTEQGELGTPIQQQFSAADPEPWARLFVTDLDRYLTEPLRDRLPESARARLGEIRRTVAATLAGRLVPVRRGLPDGPALTTARTALESLGRTGLGPAYLAAVVGQYPATVTAPYGGDGQPAARLVGSLKAAEQPDLSLAGSRTELAPSGAGCTFALDCADPSTTSAVTVSPQQVIDGVELDVPGAGPVLLRFARPLTGEYRPAAERAELPADQLPPVELPVALREHPKPVTTRPMTATATFAGPGQPTLAEAMRWTAGLSYIHQSAAQDVVELSIGGRPAVLSVAAPIDLALAEALARYAAAAPELVGLIGSDEPPPAGVDAGGRRENAATTLTELAAAVATAWQGHRAERPTAAAPSRAGTPDEAQLAGDYRLRAIYASDPDGGYLLDRLVVTRTGAAGAWPEIAVEAGERELGLTPGPVAEDTREYSATEQPTVSGALTVRLAWPGLLDPPAPGTAVTLSAHRNLALPGISPDFVLTARPVRVEVTSPSLRWSEPLPLPGDDLAQALQNAFADLSGGRPDCRIRVEVDYAEPVGDLHPGVPVLLVPALAVGPNSGAEITASLRAWQQDHQPSVAGARWQVLLAVLSPRAGEPPLITFEQLVFPVGEPERMRS